MSRKGKSQAGKGDDPRKIANKAAYDATMERVYGIRPYNIAKKVKEPEPKP